MVNYFASSGWSLLHGSSYSQGSDGSILISAYPTGNVTPLSIRTYDTAVNPTKPYLYEGHEWSTFWHNKLEGTVINAPTGSLPDYIQHYRTKYFNPMIVGSNLNVVDRQLTGLASLGNFMGQVMFHSFTFPGLNDKPGRCIQYNLVSHLGVYWSDGKPPHFWYNYQSYYDSITFSTWFAGYCYLESVLIPSYNTQTGEFRYAYDYSRATPAFLVDEDGHFVRQTWSISEATNPEAISQKLYKICEGDAKYRRKVGSFPSGSAYVTRLGEGDGVPYAAPDDPDIVSKFFFQNEISLINWKEIASEAYQDLGFADVNGIAYLNDIKDLKDSVLDFVKTLKSLPRSKIKGAAQAWLSVHYGFKLFALDSVELSKQMSSYSKSRKNIARCQASSTLTVGDRTYEARYQVFFDKYEQINSEIQALLMEMDVWLTSENLWDMITYSFVIDWFVDVGERLTALDNWYRLSQVHDVICAGKSILGTTRVKASRVFRNCSGTLTASMYRRNYSPYLQQPSLTPTVTINPFDHLIESAALVISRI